MAVRADGSTDRLSRTTSLPTNTGFSMLGWFKISVDRNAYSSFFNYGTGNTKKTLQTDASGVTLVLWEGTFESGTGATLTVGTRYHLAMVHDDGASELRAYVNGVLNITAEVSSGNPGSPIEIFQAESAEWLNGCAAAVKIYSAILTAPEIAQEMWQYIPSRVANLNSWYPLLSIADDQVDYGGGGLTLTVGGTLATEDGPPIPWKGRGRRMVTAAAGDGPAFLAGRPMVVLQAVPRASSW